MLKRVYGILVNAAMFVAWCVGWVLLLLVAVAVCTWNSVKRYIYVGRGN